MSTEQCSNSSGESESQLVKRRSKPWREVEEKTLIREVLQRENVLFGTKKGRGTKTVHQQWIEGGNKLLMY